VRKAGKKGKTRIFKKRKEKTNFKREETTKITGSNSKPEVGRGQGEGL